jgi:hypothetical protein
LHPSHSSPAPNSTSSPTTQMSSYNYPHFKDEENDLWSYQDPPKIPQAMQLNFNSSPLNSKWREMFSHLVTSARTLWKAKREVRGSFLYPFLRNHGHLATGLSY